MLHIELRRWADVLVIAPLDANTLGKIASGICDNLLVGNVLLLHRWAFLFGFYCMYHLLYNYAYLFCP